MRETDDVCGASCLETGSPCGRPLFRATPPFIFSGGKFAVTLAVIGADVALVSVSRQQLRDRLRGFAKESVPSETAEQHIREIRRATRKRYSAEEKIRIVLSGLRGEYAIAELCRREGIAESMYYSPVEGVPGSRQEAAVWRHRAASLIRRSSRPSPGDERPERTGRRSS